MLNTYQEKRTLEISDIISYYKNSIKESNAFAIGVEWEKQSLNKETFKNAPYSDLKEIIEEFARIKGWGILKESGVTIGAYDGKNSISLEPGGQFELSLEPKYKIDDIEASTNEIWNMLDKIGKVYNTIFVPTGLTPVSTYNDINIVPKERYLIMKDYFNQKRERLHSVMMRETAGIQINIDYSDEVDALNKLIAASCISPYVTGFFGNSYIRENKINGYKSFRANAWLDTDKDRCGFFYKNIFENRYPSFEDYILNVLKIPMLFIERENKKISIDGKINFEEFMRNGFDGHFPTLNDYILHSSLTFPDVRLKKYIEIRNHDSNKTDMMLALCTLYKGLFSKKDTIDKILKDFRISYDELKELQINCAKFGLSFKYNGRSAYKIAEELFKLAFDSLDIQEDKIRLLKCLEMLSYNQGVSDMMLAKNINSATKLVNYSLS